MRLDREIINIRFLQLCKGNKVITIFLENKNRIIRSVIPNVGTKLDFLALIAYIRSKFKLIDFLSDKVFSLYKELVQSLSQTDFDEFFRKIHIYRITQRVRKEAVMYRKINKLKDYTDYQLPRRKIDPIDNYDKSGVYTIPFKVNSSSKTYTYVGMTPRKFFNRIKENMTYIKKGKLSTALSLLSQDIGIDILFKEVKIIAHASHYNICIIRESLEILARVPVMTFYPIIYQEFGLTYYV